MKKVLKNIKRFLLACILMFPCFLMACDGKTNKMEGKWISSDSTLVFSFTKDSLYVDTYPSGCGIAAYRLVACKSSSDMVTYYAYETINEGDSIEINQTYVVKVKDGNKIERHLISVERSPIPKNHYTKMIKLDNEISQEIEKMP